ncbi:MAG: hypothetical protein HQL97_11000 [Magnetococcales bacterium]|nr:hypothetical protein [Magnetococcales bacterium]MBF0262346.1 hypothetical protein [Magnetococcales bacterium]
MKVKQTGLIAVAALGAGLVLTLLIWLLAGPGAPAPVFTLPTAATPQTQTQPIDPALGTIMRERKSQLSGLRAPVVREVGPVPLTMLGFSETPEAGGREAR